MKTILMTKHVKDSLLTELVENDFSAQSQVLGCSMICHFANELTAQGWKITSLVIRDNLGEEGDESWIPVWVATSIKAGGIREVSAFCRATARIIPSINLEDQVGNTIQIKRDGRIVSSVDNREIRDFLSESFNNAFKAYNRIV